MSQREQTATNYSRLADHLREWINVKSSGMWPKRSMDDDLRAAADALEGAHYAEIEHEHLGCPTVKTGIYATNDKRQFEAVDLSASATVDQHEEAWAKIHDLLAAGHWPRAREIFDQAIEQDAEHAARYRWFRDHCDQDRRIEILETSEGIADMIDHHIDKARCGL